MLKPKLSSMPQTKAQKAAAEIEERLIIEALRFTPDVPPDIPEPAPGSKLVKGYLPSKSRDTLAVNEACSDGASHSLNQNLKTTSQRPIALFSSRLLALKALRRQRELAAAKILRDIDHPDRTGRCQAIKLTAQGSSAFKEQTNVAPF